MHLDEPTWWYGSRPSTVAALLTPFATAYAWAVRQRFVWRQPYRSRLPVVCAGNFTVGGTGKTPLVLALCETLSAAGERPVALTRGYGGRLAGPHWVDAADKADAVGDEALLLARAVPTVVARNRRAGAEAIEAGPYAATIIVMDDGLQNPGLAKDLVVAVVDGARGFGNGRVIPAGPLRAALPFQLSLADAILVNERQDSADGQVAGWLRRNFNGPVLCATTVPAGDTSWLRNTPVIAWAGIGAPERFFALLAGLGAEIARKEPFRDHQRLSNADAARLLSLAKQHAATLVTTEKDLARLAGATGPLAELALVSRALPIRLSLDETDTERLRALLESALKARRERPGHPTAAP